MRVLLTGSHGLIGRALLERLVADGVEVVVLARTAPARSPGDPSSPGSPGAPGAPGAPGSPGAPGASGATGRTQPRATASVAWDPVGGIIDFPALESAGPFQAVIHLAGAGIGDRRWTPRRKQEILDSRVLSTRLLTEALARLDPEPGVLVSASAIGYYGDRGTEVLDEDSGPGTGFLADLCQAWEAAAQMADGGVRVVSVRSGIVLSTRGGALARQLPLFRLGLGGRLGDGRQYVSWITLRDELAAIRRAVDDDRLVGPVNATAPGPVTNAEFTATLGRALRRPAVLAVPRPALEVALGAEFAGGALLASQRVLPGRLEMLGHQFADPELGHALSGLLARRS